MNRKDARIVWVAIVAACFAAVPARADVHVAVRDGRVDIVAKEATVGEIMAEWARVADMTILHPELLPGERVTIELQNVTEVEALAVLLRGVGGYIARRRAGTDSTRSLVDSINVMARSAPIPVASAGTAPAASPSPGRLPSPAAPTADEIIAAPAALDQTIVVALTVPPHGAPGDRNAGYAVDPPPPPETFITPEETAAAAAAQPAFSSRHALEIADPRNFQLPKMNGPPNSKPAKR